MGLPVKYFTSRLPDDPVVLGEWNIGLEKCLKYSRENDIPLFTMWTEKGCGICTSWCQALTDAGVHKDKGEVGYGFVDWLKNGIDPRSRIVLCIMSNGEKEGDSLPGQYPLPDQRYSDPYYWIWKGEDFLNFNDPFAWKGSITYWPFMAFYWQSHKIDYHCEAESICSGDYSFSQYPAHLIAKIDQIFADYQGPKPTPVPVEDYQEVKQGEDAVPPPDPIREGFKFVGWKPDYKNVQSDLTCVAQYVKDSKQYENPRYVSEISRDTTLFSYA